MWKVTLGGCHLLTLQSSLEDTVSDRLHEKCTALEKTHLWPYVILCVLDQKKKKKRFSQNICWPINK